MPLSLLTTYQDLSKVEPTINGPFTPDLATPLSKFASFVQESGWSDELSAGLIGSCTNSSYEDMVIQTCPAHQSAIDFSTDACCELGSTGEGRRVEDAGSESKMSLSSSDPDFVPRSPSFARRGPNRSEQRSSETGLLNFSRKLAPRYWLMHAARASDRSVKYPRSIAKGC